MIRFRLWPGMVFVLLGLNASIVAVTLYLAHADSSFATEPDYYQNALTWDETVRQMRNNAVLGWRAETRWASRAVGHTDVEFVVQDPAGAPITGASLAVEAFASLRPRDRIALTPSEIAPGIYQSRIPSAGRAVWEFRIRITRADDVFTASLESEAP